MIYLDHNATSHLRPGVAEVVLSHMTQPTGNPSSVHWAGRLARQKLDEARRQVAALVETHENRVILTSGGTEANNLAVLGVAASHEFQGTLITSAIEHPSILNGCALLAQRGMNVIYLPVDGQGCVNPDDVASAIDGQTRLVSIMAANNETGVLQPIGEIGALCQQKGIPFHTDATQYVGKIPMNLDGLPINLLTLSAHKFGGPMGVGALIMDPAIGLNGQIVGGGQERGRRAGSENLPGIVGFGAAAAAVKTVLPTENQTLTALQAHLEAKLLELLPDAVIFGANAKRLPNTTAIGLQGLDGETLVMTLDLAGFAISSGSACSSGKTNPSHVLKAMGVEPALNQSAVRITLGWDSSSHLVDQFVSAFYRSVDRLRQGSLPS